MQSQQTKKQRRDSAPPTMGAAVATPPPMPSASHLPPATVPAAPSGPPAAPVVQRARDAAAAARQRANDAIAAAANPPALPSGPGYNLIGEPLREMLQPYAPEGEDILHINIDIDGATLDPPLDARHVDAVLWNCLDAQCTPEIFAKLTCDEVGLPEEFMEPMVAQIRTAVKEHQERAARSAAAGAAFASGFTGSAAGFAAAAVAAAGTAGSAAAAGGERVVTLELDVESEGLRLRDRVLWDLASASTPAPEVFARGLCADLGVPELEGAVAIAVREQIAIHAAATAGGGKAAAEGAAADDGGAEQKPRGGTSVVRTEREMLEWSPHVTVVDSDA